MEQGLRHGRRAVIMGCRLGAILLAFLLTSVCPSSGSGVPIKVLVMGATAPWLSPIPSWGGFDPLLELTLIPCTVPVGGLATPQIENGRRAMRIYFPRTYGELAEQDFMVFEHMFMEFYTPTQLMDMHRAVETEGAGGFVTIGGVTHTSTEPNYAWINSKLNDAFPSIASEEIFLKWRQYGSGPGKVKINEEESLPPVLKMLIPLGADSISQSILYYMAAKEGSTVWARSLDGKEDPPFLISWTYGQGETWSNSIGMGYAWWRLTDPNRGGNPYALDAYVNILLYSTGRELPSDIAQVHAVRTGLMNFQESNEWMLSIIDFADRFGANTARIWSKLPGVTAMRRIAEEAYLEQDYEGAMSALAEAKEALHELAEEAIQLKDRALMWTYIIEWLTVAGTLMISGEVLYMTMIRRRLYRSVASTRMA